MQQNLDLSAEEAAALVALLTRTMAAVGAHSHPEGDPREAPPRACPRALAAAEGVCASKGNGYWKTTHSPLENP